MLPRDIRIQDYTYILPDSRIASRPLEARDESKLLIYNNGVIREDKYRHLDEHLPEGSLLVFNDSRVIAARIMFTKPTGGTIEIFCLEPDPFYPDANIAIAEKGNVYWQCLIGGASKWPRGESLHAEFIHEGEPVSLQARFVEPRSDCFVISLSWSPAHLPFSTILNVAGKVPLPPYIKRAPEALDKERYQTVYAKHDGSVAAPTAGLHFTPGIFTLLNKRNIETEFVTLHVGPGTFKPVSSETLADHSMHAETIGFNKFALQTLLEAGHKKTIAVGTTSLRTLESMYWLGRKIIENPSPDTVMTISQWEVYEQKEKEVGTREALEALLLWMEANHLEQMVARTSLLIAPGYSFRVVNGLITNFHQPQSTLLLLVAAFIGKEWKKVYDYALENDFRFLSYGDGCLLWLTVDR